MEKKPFYVVGGIVFIFALGFLYWKSGGGPSMKFSTIKLLDKASFIRVLNQIRQAFSENFATLLKLNRRKRRNLHRGGREYRICVRDLKEHAKRSNEKAFADVLERSRLTEEILNESYSYMKSDSDVALAFSKVCTVLVTNVSPLLTPARLTEIMQFTIEKSKEISEEDPNELNIKMRMLEDEIFDEFGFEPEEIEAGVYKYPNELGSLIQQIREINNYLLDSTNEDLF